MGGAAPPMGGMPCLGNQLLLGSLLAGAAGGFPPMSAPSPMLAPLPGYPMSAPRPVLGAMGSVPAPGSLDGLAGSSPLVDSGLLPSAQTPAVVQSNMAPPAGEPVPQRQPKPSLKSHRTAAPQQAPVASVRKP